MEENAPGRGEVEEWGMGGSGERVCVSHEA